MHNFGPHKTKITTLNLLVIQSLSTSRMTMLTALGELRDNATRKFEEFCQQITALEEKVKVISQKETDLQTVTIPVDKAKLNDLLLLNFGGEHIDVLRSTLWLYPGRNGLITLLSGKFDHLLPRDKDGRIFFDFDKRFVEPMFNYCRDLAMWNGEESSKPIHVLMKDKRSAGEQNVLDDYFKATSPLNKAQRPKITQESLILSNIQSFDEQALFDMFPNENQFASATLLYRGSRDGFRAKNFHDKCDGKPNTVTIIRNTEGNVFGGYASVPWASPENEVCVPDSSAFLFTLAVEAKVNVVQHKPLMGRNAGVYHFHSYSAVFDGQNSGQFDLVVCDSCSSGITNNGKLGEAYDSTGNVIPGWTAAEAFCVQEIEVFQLHKCDSEKCHISEKSFVPVVSPQSRKAAVTSDNDDDETLSQCTETIREQEIQLQNEAEALITELQFVAKHCGVTLPPRSEPATDDDGDGGDSDEVGQFASALAYIRELNAVLQSYDVTVGCRVVDTVTVNAGGRLVTTAKATLQQQAPEGSILANMTSDVWGHGLDRDGNIYQDVNSELFVAIINHLRLRQLLCGASIQVVPPIVVYEEQKTALDNLLSFCMLSDDLPVKTAKD